jgi:hypothetical protein
VLLLLLLLQDEGMGCERMHCQGPLPACQQYVTQQLRNPPGLHTNRSPAAVALLLLPCCSQGLMERFERKTGGFLGFDLSGIFGQK